MHTKEQLKTSLKEIDDLKAVLVEHAIIGSADPLGRITYVNDRQRQSEEALRSAHAQLGQLLEHSPAVLYVLKLEGEKISPRLVSENITTLLNFTVAETMSYDWWLGHLHPDDRERAVNSITETLGAGVSRTEYRLRHKDGHYRWVDDARRLIRDAAGEPIELIGVWTDITERKQAEENVRQASGHIARDRRKAVRIELAILLSTTVVIYQLAARFNWFEFATRWILENASERLDEIIFTIIFGAVGLGMFAFRRWRETESELTTQQQMRVALGLSHDELDRRVKQRTGELGSVNHALREEIAERKRVEDIVRESERRFRDMLVNVELIAMTLDKSGTVTFCNDFLLLLTGWKREEVIGYLWFDRFLPDSEMAVKRLYLENIGSGKVPLHHQNPIKTRTGELREIAWNNTILRDGAGNIIGMASIGEDITERSRAEAATRRSERRLRDLIDGLGPSVFLGLMTPEGILIEANRSALAAAGLKPEDVLGKPFEETYWWAYSPEIQQQLREAMARAVRGEASRYDVRLRAAENQLIDVDFSLQPVHDETGRVAFLVPSAMVITERKRAEQSLRASEALLRIAGRTARLGGWTVDLPEVRITWSDEVCAIHEVPSGTVQGIGQALGFYSPQSRETVSKAFEACAQQGIPFDLELEIITAKGRHAWVRSIGEPQRNADGAIMQVQGALQDITERKQLEEQFQQAQKMEAIGTLAGGIAHDFNNIMAAIVGYSELARLILKGNPEVHEHLEAVLQAASRATDLVRQILAFSRQQQPERRPIQLRPVVSETLDLLRATIPSTIEFDTSLATDAPTVLADATQVHQVLMNLGTNAWHAMKDQTGRLQVKLERCVVDVAHAATQSRLRPGLYARVSISDTGSGMDQATLQRIFEPFFTTKPPGEGTGLGLAVVHGIMDNHDGAITVYSHPGEGTVFHLYFPAHAGEAIVAAAEVGPTPRGNGEQVLFVDDEELLVRLGHKTLIALDYEVEVTTQPAAALAMVRADPQRFALVLTDLTMPGMTGLQLASQLRQIRPGLPIILMTGYSASLTSERAEAAGIRQLLLKPTTIHSLGVAVHAALSSQPPP